MGTRRKILALGLILALSSQTVAVDYLHHHLVTGIPGHDLCCSVAPSGSSSSLVSLATTTSPDHLKTDCPFCLFLQNYHGRTSTPVFASSGIIHLAGIATYAGEPSPLPGHLNHAGPRAPPSSRI